MNRFPLLNKRYLTISIYAAAVIAVAILFQKAVGSIEGIAAAFGAAIRAIGGVLGPFLYGFVIAYTINTGVKSLETRLFSRFHGLGARAKRLLSITVCYVIALGAISWVIAYLVPEISANVQRLTDNLTTQFNSANYTLDMHAADATIDWVNETFSTDYTTQDAAAAVRDQFLKVFNSVPQVISTVYTGAVRAAGVLLNLLLGLVIAFYMLYEKENYAAVLKKITFAAFKRDTASAVVASASRANATFERFIIGKALDSLIIGLLYFIICTVLNVRYAPLLALIVGVTNMIPYFGPFIGAVPAVLIVMSYDMTMGLWMILIILILQQIDGILIGPKILGDSIGMKPMGVIFSILVGGWLAGVAGMFFGVPLFAILWTFVSSLIDRKYDEKNGVDAPPPTRRLLETSDPTPPPFGDSVLNEDHSFEYSQLHKKPKNSEDIP